MAALDFLFGHGIRRIETSEKKIFLTFDDGPAKDTNAVLDILGRNRAQATFFLIANAARTQMPIVRRILAEGHAIGNHSLDHRYLRYWTGRTRLKTWILDSEKALQDLIGKPTVGFRPPAGIRTPHFGSVLREIKEPLILWSTRFFDAFWPWTERVALRSLETLECGDIILLHDRQRPRNAARFLASLECYLTQATKLKFKSERLERRLFQKEYL